MYRAFGGFGWEQSDWHDPSEEVHTQGGGASVTVRRVVSRGSGVCLFGFVFCGVILWC